MKVETYGTMILAMSFSQDLYLKALTVAARAHGEQKTPIGLRDIVHVSSVAMEVMAALRAEPGDEDLALACALLHDVPAEVAMVKLADRITNLAAAADSGSGTVAIERERTIALSDVYAFRAKDIRQEETGDRGDLGRVDAG
ncbi:MAG: hypothetical protein ACREVG_11955 [Burkholderiales bacterium]